MAESWKAFRGFPGFERGGNGHMRRKGKCVAANRFFRRIFATLLALTIYSTTGWTMEHVVEKVDGKAIVVPEFYESGDIVKVVGDQLSADDWVEFRKMWRIGFHLELANGQTEIPDRALSTNNAVASAVISIRARDVVSIGMDVFSNNNYLESMDLPSLKSIGEMAFFSCGALRQVELPSPVDSIGDGAFAICKNLSEISTAKGNTNFKSVDGILCSADGAVLYTYPAGRTAAKFESNVIEVRPFAFYGAGYLENVTLSSVKIIGNAAFVSCLKLMAVSLPEGLKTISHGAFDSCMTLQTINLPASLEELGDGAFSYCDNLLSIVVASGSNIFKTIDGVLFSFDENAIHAYPPGKKEKNFMSAAKEVKPYAFMGARKLQTVTLPSATAIGEGAFAWCSALTGVSLPSAETFGNGAFAWCVSLRFMALGETIPSIEAETFPSAESDLLLAVPDTGGYVDADMNGWPTKTCVMKLNGTAALGPIFLSETKDILVLSLDIEGVASYQWKKDGVSIPGAIAPAYVKQKITSEDAGAYATAFRYDTSSRVVDIEVGSIVVEIK
jgi:hypothetical protein